MKKQVTPNPQGPTPKIGMQVFLPELEVYGEVYEISQEIKNLITKVKLIKADGKIEIHEVADLVVEAVTVLSKIAKSKFVKWFKNLFKKKK
jgi:hypothetical protein